MLAAGVGAALLLFLRGCGFGGRESNRARTLPTLPTGGRASLSFMLSNVVFDGATALMGLDRATASFAAMLDGDGVRSTPCSGTPNVLELLDWLRSLMAGSSLEAVLPPVLSLDNGEMVL